jgi:hypothetical protein
MSYKVLIFSLIEISMNSTSRGRLSVRAVARVVGIFLTCWPSMSTPSIIYMINNSIFES